MNTMSRNLHIAVYACPQAAKYGRKGPRPVQESPANPIRFSVGACRNERPSQRHPSPRRPCRINSRPMTQAISASATPQILQLTGWEPPENSGVVIDGVEAGGKVRGIGRHTQIGAAGCFTHEQARSFVLG